MNPPADKAVDGATGSIQKKIQKDSIQKESQEITARNNMQGAWSADLCPSYLGIKWLRWVDPIGEDVNFIGPSHLQDGDEPEILMRVYER